MAPQQDYGPNFDGFVTASGMPTRNARGYVLRDDSFAFGDSACDPAGHCLTGGFTP